MTNISFNSSSAASALQSMSNAATGLGSSAKEYLNALENDVFANLSGTTVQNFINQSNTHCDNLGKIAKDLNEITSTLDQIRKHHEEKDQTISRM